jgi:hypothetical protein
MQFVWSSSIHVKTAALHMGIAGARRAVPSAWQRILPKSSWPALNNQGGFYAKMGIHDYSLFA